MGALAVVKIALIIFVFFSSPLYLVKCESVPFRLPNTTVPMHYNIQISTKLNHDNFNFNGNVFIKIRALKAVNEIVLHSKEAKISKVELLSSNFGKVDVENFTHNKINEFLTIILKSNLLEDQEYELRIWYTSELREDKLGFYRSSYTNVNGETVWLAATQFAPTEARHAFPCYDEPKLKTTFKLEITHPTYLKAISNTDAVHSLENQDGTITTEFKKTQIMSTYLVGFVISDFDSASYKSESFTQEVYARKNGLNQTKFSGKYGLSVLQHFMNFFEEKFPVDTMKHVAIPDFYFSGMENWGMVTYRERIFFFDNNINTISHMLRAVTLISHEMAHSWFGNLVTMHWWTYVWLKEGFSTLYAYYGADAVLSNIDVIQLFQIEKMHYVFKIDGEDDTRPMTHYVEKQMEIMKNYDKIAYDKSACVLRMIDHAFGHEVFLKGVKAYLKKHKFRTTEEDDLFLAFQNNAPSNFLNVSKVFKSWTSQKGYPLLTVTRDYEASELVITQEKFLNDGETNSHSIWHIPINLETERTNMNFTDTRPDFWISNKFQKITTKDIKSMEAKWSPDKWIILNKQQTGYYRVNYDIKNWQLLTKSLKNNHSVIHVNNRAQLVDDAFALAISGRLSYSVVLNLTMYLKNEMDYAPWAAFDKGMESFKKHFYGTPFNEGFFKYMREIIEIPLSKIGIKSEDSDEPLKKLTRKIIVMYACEYGSEKCQFSNISPDDPELRTFHYCDLMRKQSKPTYLKFRKILRNSKDYFLRKDIISSFGCTTDKYLLSLFLSSSTETPSDLKLSTEERLTLLESIYQKGSVGFNLTLHFLTNDWKTVKFIFPDASLDNIIINMARYINTPKLKHTFELMVANMNIPTVTLTSAKSHITSNFRWNLLHKEEFDSLLFDLIAANMDIPKARLTSAKSHLSANVGLMLLIILYSIVTSL